MAPKPDALDFGDETYRGPDGSEIAISTVWRRIDESSYEAITTSAANPAGDRVIRFTRID